MSSKRRAQLGRPSNPYGRTKKLVENILGDLAESNKDWHIAALRYFNPIGAHSSGLIGESPNGFPNNLVPILMKVAIRDLDELTIFGNDYNTLDGTCIRDYIHVMDLAEGHLQALLNLPKFDGFNCWNLGTGKGYSVLQVIKKFEEITGKVIKYKFGNRRR